MNTQRIIEVLKATSEEIKGLRRIIVEVKAEAYDTIATLTHRVFREEGSAQAKLDATWQARQLVEHLEQQLAAAEDEVKEEEDLHKGL